MRHILVEPVRNGLEVFGRRAMAGLELAQSQYVDLAGDAVIMVAALDAQHVAFPAVFVRCANAAVAELAVVALDDVGVDIQGGGFHQGVKGVGIAVPFWNE